MLRVNKHVPIYIVSFYDDLSTDWDIYTEPENSVHLLYRYRYLSLIKRVILYGRNDDLCSKQLSPCNSS